MQLKKNQKKNLENYRGIFFLVGIALSLAVVTEIIQLQTDYEVPPFEPKEQEATMGTAIPITVREEPKIPEPKNEPIEIEPIIDPTDRLTIVENNHPVLEIYSANISDDPELIEYEPLDGYDNPEPIAPFNVEQMARPKSCESLRGKEEQMECFNQWISNYIAEEVEFPRSNPFFTPNGEKIYVEFIINTEGGVEQVKILKGKNPDFQKEAVRVIQSMPELVPATQFGRKVPVRVQIPVNFKIQ